MAGCSNFILEDIAVDFTAPLQFLTGNIIGFSSRR